MRKRKSDPKLNTPPPRLAPPKPVRVAPDPDPPFEEATVIGADGTTLHEPVEAELTPPIDVSPSYPTDVVDAVPVDAVPVDPIVPIVPPIPPPIVPQRDRRKASKVTGPVERAFGDPRVTKKR